MKSSVLTCFLLLPLFFLSQNEKIDFKLKAAIKKASTKKNVPDDEKSVSIFIKGETDSIEEEVVRLGGKVKMAAGDLTQVLLPAGAIAKFSENNFVQRMEYSYSKGMPLNDLLLDNTNVTPIHSGTTPLQQSYTGKGVVMGFIDTGIDITHPDFKDADGKTRIMALWDQAQDTIWDSTSINNGSCTHVDPLNYSGHGTHVTGIGAGNGSALNKYKGVAPEADIVFVATDFSALDWNSTVVDAVRFIYEKADALGKPCVINISAGNYAGSHDGTDAAAQLINSMVNEKSGRALVCAAGNEGDRAFHLQHQVNEDTTFTWFKYNPTSGLGYGAVFYEIWADTADLNDVYFSVGANLPSGSYEERGSTPFLNIKDRMGLLTDTIKNGANVIGIVDTYGELMEDKYLLQIHLFEPDSNTYLFSLKTTGNGKLDAWSDGFMGYSDIVKEPLPTSAIYPNIIYYQAPDTLQTIVSSFSCLPSVLTVGTLHNRNTYQNMDNVSVTNTDNIGEISLASSIGPTRSGVTKPDISASGQTVISTGAQNIVSDFISKGGAFIDAIVLGDKHLVKSGTSMASPAVAGVVALYLEKCPSASMMEIKNAVTTTAIQDGHTGGTPNNIYGYGKINAFETLNLSNINIELTDKSICEGDSVLMEGPASFIHYNWSTEDTTFSIYIDTTMEVHLEVSNSSGCTGLSDTAQIVLRELPDSPNLRVQGKDTLICYSNATLNWYWNGSLIAGAADSIYVVKDNGEYHAKVTNEHGCSVLSDTITFLTLDIPHISYQSAFDLYPNPAQNSLTLILKENISPRGVKLIGMDGKIHFHQELDKSKKSVVLDLNDIAKGIYFLSLKTDVSRYFQKVVLN